MSIRLDYTKYADPEPLQAMSALSGYLHQSALDSALLSLIELRASQLNGCAYCIDMHTKDLYALNEDNARIYLLPAWREASVYTEAERAAFAWTEAVTQLHAGSDLHSLYEDLTRYYDPQQIVRMTFAIVAINGWNRLSVAFGRKVGSYTPGDLDSIFSSSLEKLRT